ncbi:hypothetical protein AB0H69_41195 [Streptomyces phaeochromogenes]|uniref:hypothetical protein n=1 Tax=Streptomyces phaeochromogenes TaxID=1923 RepID=UPI0033F874F1
MRPVPAAVAEPLDQLVRSRLLAGKRDIGDEEISWHLWAKQQFNGDGTAASYWWVHPASTDCLAFTGE